MTPYVPQCTCLESVTMMCPIHLHLEVMTAEALVVADNAGCAPAPMYRPAVTCAVCGAWSYSAGPCWNCAERAARQAALRDVAERARSDERARIVAWLRLGGATALAGRYVYGPHQDANDLNADALERGEHRP